MREASANVLPVPGPEFSRTAGASTVMDLSWFSETGNNDPFCLNSLLLSLLFSVQIPNKFWV